MAVARTARIVASTPVGGRGRLLHLELQDEEPLGFTGGQYVIINTGVPRADGKQHKRAYSIISSDEEQRAFSLAVYRLPEGPGSCALHEAPVGAEFQFSGPWGSFLPDDAVPRRTLVVATDSGITAALGLLRGRAFAPQREQVLLAWLSESPEAFLPLAPLRAEVEAEGGRFVHHLLAPPGHPERPEEAWARVKDAALGHVPERIFLSGDGAVLHPLRQRLLAEGVDALAIRLESFFNNPSRKAAA
ncbi:MAG TPA: FAD-dependent oxidoreductase [Longimicrobiales bacterium]|nr:FAD-dependent oxidoreductase [Longimicrobiales bacterium]